MHHSAAYLTFFLFEHCYYAVADVLFLIFVWRASAILARSSDAKWRAHREWLVPFVISSATGLNYRAFSNLVYFLKWRPSESVTVFFTCITIVGGIFGLVGAYRLYRMLRLQVPQLSLLDRAANEWPQVTNSNMPIPAEVAEKMHVSRESS